VGVSTICIEQEKREREKKKRESCCYTYVSRLNRTEGLKEKNFRSSSNIHAVSPERKRRKKKKLGLPLSD